MDYTEFKNLVIEAAKNAEVESFEIYYSTTDSISASAFKAEISEMSCVYEGGVCLKVIADGKIGSASTEKLTADEAVSLVNRAVSNAKSIDIDDPAIIYNGSGTYAEIKNSDLQLPSVDKVRNLLLDCQNELYKADSRIVDGSLSEAAFENTRVAICNSNGVDLDYSNGLSVLGISAQVAENGETEVAYELQTGDFNVNTATKSAVQKALKKLGAGKAPTGTIPVVFAPTAMKDMLWAFNDVFSAERVQKGLGGMKAPAGSVVASEIVTIVDDPMRPGAPMPRTFDDEGYPTYKKNVIENGVLKTLLYTLVSAAKENRGSTGNASKPSYWSSTETGFFSMYIAPGSETEEELLNRVGEGIYIDSLGGTHSGTDEVSGDFSLQCGGFLIENGKLTKPVKLFTVAGNFFNLLKNITGLSDTVEFPMATGKTCFGSPLVLVEGLTIAG